MATTKRAFQDKFAGLLSFFVGILVKIDILAEMVRKWLINHKDFHFFRRGPKRSHFAENSGIPHFFVKIPCFRTDAKILYERNVLGPLLGSQIAKHAEFHEISRNFAFLPPSPKTSVPPHPV